MFSAGYAVRAAHEAPPGRLLPLQNCRPISLKDANVALTNQTTRAFDDFIALS